MGSIKDANGNFGTPMNGEIVVLGEHDGRAGSGGGDNSSGTVDMHTRRALAQHEVKVLLRDLIQVTHPGRPGAMTAQLVRGSIKA